MYRSYYVDYRDGAYPQIGRTWVETRQEVRTFTSCKREIVSYAVDLARHWHYIANETRKLTKKECDESNDRRDRA